MKEGFATFYHGRYIEALPHQRRVRANRINVRNGYGSERSATRTQLHTYEGPHTPDVSVNGTNGHVSNEMAIPQAPLKPVYRTSSHPVENYLLKAQMGLVNPDWTNFSD